MLPPDPAASPSTRPGPGIGDTKETLRVLVGRIDQDEHLRRRVVQDAIAQALAGTWTSRANLFADALPQPGDHPGGPVDWDTGEQLDPRPADDKRTVELRGVVHACRVKAALLESGWLDA